MLITGSGFLSDSDFSDAHINEAHRILSSVLIRKSTFKEDTQQATDLVVSAGRVALRVRTCGFFRYILEEGHHATVRGHRGSGRETEDEKIFTKGLADIMLYAFSTISGVAWKHFRYERNICMPEFTYAVVLDLKATRKAVEQNHSLFPENLTFNKCDMGQTGFRNLWVKALPRECVLLECGFAEAKARLQSFKMPGKNILHA